MPDAANRSIPLRRRYVCEVCLLVQLDVFETPEQIFREYSYFSSYSTSWLEHAESYVQQMLTERGIAPGQRVVELASNDGYLLQYFIRAGVEVLGIDPASNVAAVARERGVPTSTSSSSRGRDARRG